MTKKEIIEKVEDEKANLMDIIYNLYDLIMEANEDIIENNKINDLEKFIRKLKEENLYTKELEEFIANYIRYDNGDDE